MFCMPRDTNMYTHAASKYHAEVCVWRDKGVSNSAHRSYNRAIIGLSPAIVSTHLILLKEMIVTKSWP